jgi:predicted metal-dependent phosphoesterase TrpH
MRLRADLHLHDEESRIPDERLGRLLGFSETWVTLEQQRRVLASNGVELLTITNHNNARSCWRLLEAGHDVLPGAEFTCHFRQIDLSIHVLTYGFTPAQEARLNGLRRDALKFLSFCLAHELPTVLAHPLHFYSRRGLAVDDFNLLYVVFDRFEVLNGQREPWSNLLALAWVNSFSEEKCASVERRFGLKRADFCCLKEKALTGGSDDHYALYTGGTTTSFDLSGSTADMPTSARARLALWTGKTRAEGVSARFENHAVPLLAYLCQ